MGQALENSIEVSPNVKLKVHSLEEIGLGHNRNTGQESRKSFPTRKRCGTSSDKV